MVEGVVELRRASGAYGRAEGTELLEADAAVAVLIGFLEHHADLLLAGRGDAEAGEEELELMAGDLSVSVVVEEVEDLEQEAAVGGGEAGGGEYAFGGFFEVDGGIGAGGGG